MPYGYNSTHDGIYRMAWPPVPTVIEAKFSGIADIINTIDKYINKQVDEQIKNYPLRVYVDGKDVDIAKVTYGGGEVNIFLVSPLYVHKTDELLKVVGDGVKWISIKN